MQPLFNHTQGDKAAVRGLTLCFSLCCSEERVVPSAVRAISPLLDGDDRIAWERRMERDKERMRACGVKLHTTWDNQSYWVDSISADIDEVGVFGRCWRLIVASALGAELVDMEALLSVFKKPESRILRDFGILMMVGVYPTFPDRMIDVYSVGNGMYRVVLPKGSAWALRRKIARHYELSTAELMQDLG